MKWKQEIERVAEKLNYQQNLVNMPGEAPQPVAIRVIEKIAPEGYFIPQLIYTSKKPETRPALYCEIWVNSVCIWRQSLCLDKPSHLREDYPDDAVDRIWREIYTEMGMFAIMNNYKFTIELHKRRTKSEAQAIHLKNEKVRDKKG